MKIIKKRISEFFTDYVIFETDEGTQIKICFTYWNRGVYFVQGYVATKPQNKRFKGWEYVGRDLLDDEEYNTSLREMLESYAIDVLTRYENTNRIRLMRQKNWEEFINTP